MKQKIVTLEYNASATRKRENVATRHSGNSGHSMLRN